VSSVVAKAGGKSNDGQCRSNAGSAFAVAECLHAVVECGRGQPEEWMLHLRDDFAGALHNERYVAQKLQRVAASCTRRQ